MQQLKKFQKTDSLTAGKIFRGIGIIVAVILLLAGIYLFLLLGEPDEDQKYLIAQKETEITSPINSMEITDSAGLQNLSDSFGQPVLCFYSGAELQRARLSDTSFNGEYARIVTLTYQTESGNTVTVKSVRPKRAAAILSQENGTLKSSSLYTIAGMSAIRIDTSLETIFLTQSDDAAYAIYYPGVMSEETTQLLRRTNLISPASQSSPET